MDPVGPAYHNDTQDPSPICYPCPPPVQTYKKHYSFNYRVVVVSTATLFALTLATVLGATMLYYLYLFSCYVCSYTVYFFQQHSDSISIMLCTLFILGILFALDDTHIQQQNSNLTNNKQPQWTLIPNKGYFFKYKHTKTHSYNIWTSYNDKS